MYHARLSRRHLPFVLTLLGGLAMAACGAPSSTPSRPGLAARPARGEWPSAIPRARPAVQMAYRYAVDNPRTLAVIPCYRGCTAEGHRSNEDCYIVDMPVGENVLLDRHGLGRGHCVAITLEVMHMKVAGHSLRDIRATIDSKWRGALPGTDTPLPPD